MLQAGSSTLQHEDKFKYLTLIPRETEGEAIRLIHALAMTNAVLRELYRSVLRKRELSNTAKSLVLKSVFIPIVICGHESQVMTKKILYKAKAADMGFLRRVYV